MDTDFYHVSLIQPAKMTSLTSASALGTGFESMSHFYFIFFTLQHFSWSTTPTLNSLWHIDYNILCWTSAQVPVTNYTAVMLVKRNKKKSTKTVLSGALQQNYYQRSMGEQTCWGIWLLWSALIRHNEDIQLLFKKKTLMYPSFFSKSLKTTKDKMLLFQQPFVGD